MVEQNPPDFLGANCYTFQDFRQTFGGVVCGEGVTEAGDLLVTAVGGASINVNVAAGTAWVDGNLNGSSGMYFVTNNASVPVTIAANGAGSSRIDRIIASVYDSQYIGAADSWAIEVVQGTAGGGVPAVPDSTRSGWLELGQVTVPASGGTPSTVAAGQVKMTACGGTNIVGANRILAATNTFTNPTTETVFPQAADRTALTTTLYKSRDASTLEVHLSGVLDETADAGSALVTVGLKIGSNNYSIASNLLETAESGNNFTGHMLITAETAGSKTIEPFVLTSGNATEVSWAGLRWSYTVKELA